MKVNIISIKDGKMQWKQIEKRNGKVFMRFKQRIDPCFAMRDPGQSGNLSGTMSGTF